MLGIVEVFRKITSEECREEGDLETYPKMIVPKFRWKAFAMSKSRLEIVLDKLKKKGRPNSRLEQHRTPGWIAADMIWMAKERGFIDGAKILDLGSGDGVLCIGSLLAGASSCISLEIDDESIEVQISNIRELGIEGQVDVVRADVRYYPFRNNFCDLAIINPPFGTVERGIDLEFLIAATKSCNATLSLHLSNDKSRDFISREMEKIGKKAVILKTYKMELKQIFEYHKSRIRRIDVDLYLVK
jgi:predicted RNA methylase